MLRYLKSIDLNPLSTDRKGKSGKNPEMWWQWRQRGKDPGAHLFLLPRRAVASGFLCVPGHCFTCSFTLSRVYCVIYSTIGPIYQMFNALEIYQDDIAFVTEKRAYQVAETTLKLLGKCFMFACMLVQLKKSLRIKVIRIFCHSFSFSRFYLKSSKTMIN